MKKKLFLSGSVFEFFVPEIMKYACCRILDFTYIQPFGGLIGQVYDKFSDSPIVDLNQIFMVDWLFGARSLYKWPATNKRSGFRYIGVVSSTTDEIIPDFKGCNSFPYIVDDESTIGPWYPVINLVAGDFCEYYRVRHLEQMIITPMSGIVIRTGMEYARINRLDVSKFYNLEDEVYKSVFQQMINTPRYKDIPVEDRGKARMS